MAKTLLVTLLVAAASECIVHAGSNSPGCTPKKSLSTCQNCFTKEQCKEGYCCPYMKKCVLSKETSCSHPIARCSPRCYDNMDPQSCTGCSNPDFPDNWAKPTCQGAGYTLLGDGICGEGCNSQRTVCNSYNIGGKTFEQCKEWCNTESSCTGISWMNNSSYPMNNKYCLLHDRVPMYSAPSVLQHAEWAIGFQCFQKDGAVGGKTCADTNNGAKGEYGLGCDIYKDYRSWCGSFDDSDFNSRQMCCFCGGGNL